MKIKYFQYILGICILLFLQACGSTSNRETNSHTETKKAELFTKDNFVSLAQFHFSKESRKLLKNSTQTKNNDKFRSYPGAKPLDVLNDKALKITTVTPFDKYIESMTLSTPKQTIKVEVKNKIYVIVSLYENGTLVSSKKQTMNEFKNFNLLTDGAL